MEGSPYRKFFFSQEEGAVPGTGPGVFCSGDPGCFIAGTQRPVSCLGSGGILYLSIFSPTCRTKQNQLSSVQAGS
ncbi:hypothetical protein DY000_02053452 [Brassica cretica]|uniref:Uncharacterized protein n=1 Tax=Brassica cretica TaxID=69181 RepID=A0ABQ7AJ26_BRACR|nr:hypothetical protein DY000_02053452 [Brassica cretica]